MCMPQGHLEYKLDWVPKHGPCQNTCYGQRIAENGSMIPPLWTEGERQCLSFLSLIKVCGPTSHLLPDHFHPDFHFCLANGCPALGDKCPSIVSLWIPNLFSLFSIIPVDNSHQLSLTVSEDFEIM